jgi:hypothetical protein
MDMPARQLRLFDIKRYREIQPTIEGIAKRSASAEQVISSLEAALDVAKSEDFSQHNSPNDPKICTATFQDILDIVQISGVSKWFAMLDQKIYGGVDILQELFLFICCPKFQRSRYEAPVISGTTVEYEDFYYGFELCDLYLLEMLSFSYPSEKLPVEMKGEGIASGIFSQQQLELITEITTEDTIILSEVECSSKDNQERKLNYLEFYKNFNHLLKLANSHSEYTILNTKYN